MKLNMFRLPLFFGLAFCLGIFGFQCFKVKESAQSATIIAQLQKSVDRSAVLLDEQNKPTQALLDLLKVMNVEHDGTLASIVAKTQEQWLRAPGKERWEIEEMHAEKRDAALILLKQLNALQEIKPMKQEYAYGVLLGAMVTRVRIRLNYCLELWKNGVRFNQLVFLGSARPLDLKLESEEILLDINNGLIPCKADWILHGELPKTEMEMMKMVYDQTDLPEGFSEVSVVFVDTPMMVNPDGSTRRATTADTIKSWMAIKEKDGSSLFVSNNPYIGYQDSVVRYYMPQDSYIETVGPQAKDDELLSVHLDNLARWLYQEKLRRTK